MILDYASVHRQKVTRNVSHSRSKGLPLKRGAAAIGIGSCIFHFHYLCIQMRGFKFVHESSIISDQTGGNSFI